MASDLGSIAMMGNLIGLAIGLGLAGVILLAGVWVGGFIRTIRKYDED